MVVKIWYFEKRGFSLRKIHRKDCLHCLLC